MVLKTIILKIGSSPNQHLFKLWMMKTVILERDGDVLMTVLLSLGRFPYHVITLFSL